MSAFERISEPSPNDVTLPLTLKNLDRVRAGVITPSFNPRDIEISIVHLGPGAFHRAHQAVFADDLLGRDPRWGICAVSLKSSGLRDALVAQENLYTVAVLDAAVSYRVIGSLREVLVAAEDSERVLARLAAPATRIVTSTITEKGYCLDGNGELDLEHADIRHDLANPQSPVSAIGYLVEGLRRRRAAGLAPFTTICCDNLTDNGGKLGRAVIRLARERDTDLARWIEAEAAFPRTMVDSIVPASDDALRARVEESTGLIDHWPVQREAFAQWVIEDRFCNETPDWAGIGVTITDDVAGYESAKLRLLNGAHSTLAYLGLARGHTSVAEAMADVELAGFVRKLMIEDIRPCVRVPRGLDIDAYIEAVLQRFRNPAIRHELAQIAWDGSQKLPFRILGTIIDALSAGRSVNRLCVPIAAWMHFVRSKARTDRHITDPLAVSLLAIGDACTGSSANDLPRFLALDMFQTALHGDPRFTSPLAVAYDRLAAPGAL
jgi:fructuronate reductase